MQDATSQAGEGLRHEAFFYGTTREYLDGTGDFIRAGIDAGEPVFVAVPGPRRDLIVSQLPDHAAGVRFIDMGVVGRNPSRIIPAVRGFLHAHPDRRIRFIGESTWRGRGPAETVEAARHEAVVNLEFADAAISMLCPYDTVGLAASTLARAARTHPVVLSHDLRRRSTAYTDPRVVYAATDWPLPPRPVEAPTLEFGRRGLTAVLRFVWLGATAAGTEPDRIRDLLAAVAELVRNTVAHAGGRGTVATWPEPDGTGLICELRDPGRILDPLVGRVAPQPGSEEIGRGLWLVNQICDLVELRSGADGTTIRVHIGERLPDKVMTGDVTAGHVTTGEATAGEAAAQTPAAELTSPDQSLP